MKRLFGALVAAVLTLGILGATPVWAEEPSTAPSVTLKQAIASLKLDPGQTYNGFFEIENSGSTPFDLTAAVEYFTPGAINGERFTSEGRYTEIHNWVRLAKTEFAKVQPGATQRVDYTVEVPVDAPAGSQYTGINVAVKSGDVADEALGVVVSQQIQYRIYANVSGETITRGDVSAYNIPGWVKSGDLVTSMAVKNDGNTDFTAAGRLVVKSLFGREIYRTPEGEQVITFVFPEGESEVIELTMPAPKIGIYRVTQLTELAGRVIEKTGLVLVAPIWLVVVAIIGLLAAVALITILIVRLVKKQRNYDKKDLHSASR